MSWLKKFTRQSLKKVSINVDHEVPDNLWLQCPKCSQSIFHRDLLESQHTCTSCGHHFRLTAKQRLDSLFDESEYQLIELPQGVKDPLKFKDLKKYTDRLKVARKQTGLEDAVLVGLGKVNGVDSVILAFAFEFMAGSMGTAVGEAFVTAADLAITQEASFIVIPSSGGARMQEGLLSLMQMARTTVAIQKVRHKRIPYITVLADPTTGGVSASFAMLGDVSIAEKGAVIGFAGRRVIEQTIREQLPEDFQTAEYLLDHGMIDLVVERKDLKKTVGMVSSLLLNTSEKKKAKMITNKSQI